MHSQALARAILDVPQIPRDDEDRRISDELLDDMLAGRAKCADLEHAGRVVGSLVYEVRGVVLIIHALRADNIPADCTALGESLALEIARANKCRLISCDTKRPGLVVKLVEMGWAVHSVALRKTV